MRTCTECGAEYDDRDPTLICNNFYVGEALTSGKKGEEIRVSITNPRYCQGKIQPPPDLPARAPAAKPSCLVCLDSGRVLLHDGTFIKCHRGCEAPHFSLEEI